MEQNGAGMIGSLFELEYHSYSVDDVRSISQGYGYGGFEYFGVGDHVHPNNDTPAPPPPTAPLNP